MGREMGGRSKTEGIYVYLWLFHVEVRQKTAKFCKANDLQLKEKKPIGLQGQIPWEFPVPLLSPQAGRPYVGFRTFTTVGELHGIIVLQFVGHPPGRYGILF